MIRPSLLTSLRSLPRPAWVLFGGTFVNRFGTFVMPFLAIYLTRQGYSATEAGVALSVYGAGHIVASMLGGHLADRIGRRHTIALSMLGSGVMMMALSQARSYASILVCTFLVALVGELYRPAASALLGDLVTPDQRVVAFGMYRFAINLGFAIGPATAGFLADRSFFWIFAIDAATSFAYGIVAFFALPHGVRSSASNELPGEGLRVAFRDRAFVLFLLSTLFLTWVEFQVTSTVPLYIQSQGHSASTYGLLMSLNGVMIVTLELALISWTQRYSPQVMIAIGYALTGIGFALTAFATNVPLLAMTVVIWTLGEMIYAPVTGAYVTTLAPERYRGRYMGLWHLMWSMGLLIGPATGTMLLEYNANLLWAACLVMGLLAAALALIKAKPRVPAVLLATLIFSAPLAHATDHNDPNSMNPIFGNVPVDSADLTGMFGWPTNDGNHLILVLPFQPVPATGSFDREVLYRIHVNPTRRVGRRATDTTLDSLLDYAKRSAEEVVDEKSYEVRVTFNDAHEAVIDFIDFPGGTFRKTVVTDEIYRIQTATGHLIHLFIGGRDDPFIFDLPGFRRSINYAPEFFNVPLEAPPSQRELAIPKSLLHLEGNDLINDAPRPSIPANFNYSNGPLFLSLQKPTLPDVPLTWNGNAYRKDANGNYRFMYSGADAQKGLNVNAIIVQLPLAYITSDPQNERVVNVWGESWVLKASNRLPAVPNSSGSKRAPKASQNKYKEQLAKYKRVDTAGVPLADTILSLGEDNRQLGPDNVSLATWFVRRFAHLGWGFGPSMTAMGVPTCFDHGDVAVSKLVNYSDPITAFIPVAKCLFQELNMPAGWNPRNKSIPLKRPYEIVIPNVNTVDMDTTGTWPYGFRPDDQVATRFIGLFLDHTKNCGSTKCTLESLNDPTLWKGMPIEPKTPPNPLHNDKPYLEAFPYLAEPHPR